MLVGANKNAVSTVVVSLKYLVAIVCQNQSVRGFQVSVNTHKGDHRLLSTNLSCQPGVGKLFVKPGQSIMHKPLL